MPTTPKQVTENTSTCKQTGRGVDVMQLSYTCVFTCVSVKPSTAAAAHCATASASLRASTSASASCGDGFASCRVWQLAMRCSDASNAASACFLQIYTHQQLLSKLGHMSFPCDNWPPACKKLSYMTRFHSMKASMSRVFSWPADQSNLIHLHPGVTLERHHNMKISL